MVGWEKRRCNGARWKPLYARYTPLDMEPEIWRAIKQKCKTGRQRRWSGSY
jgi:hypothetical protein